MQLSGTQSAVGRPVTARSANLKRLRDSLRILESAGELDATERLSTDEDVAHLVSPSLQVALTAACSLCAKSDTGAPEPSRHARPILLCPPGPFSADC